MTQPAPQLDYGTRPPTHWRKHFRYAIIGVVLLAVVFAGWRVVPRVRGTIEMLSLYHSAMRLTRPPTLVVVEPDPARAKKLMATSPDYFSHPAGGAHHLPLIGAGARIPCVFLHARRTPSGAERLVRVSEEPQGGGSTALLTWASAPATLFNLTPKSTMTPSPLPPGPPGERPRLFAGQPDPTDASRFTIKYEYSDRSGVLRGSLRDDDSVLIEPIVDAPSEEAMP